MRRANPCVLALPLILAVVGCTSVSRYFQDRGRDLADCVRGGVALGFGLFVEAEVTAFCYPAVGLLDVTLDPQLTVEWDPRPDRPSGEVRTAAMPLLVVGWPFYGYHETTTGYHDTHPFVRGAVAPWILMGNHHVAGKSHSLFGLHAWIPNPRLAKSEAEGASEKASDDTWLASSATLVFLRLEAGANPLELLDFVTGWFRWDLLGDDTRSSVESVAERVSPERPAERRPTEGAPP